jgi:hypothetical protein
VSIRGRINSLRIVHHSVEMTSIRDALLSVSTILKEQPSLSQIMHFFNYFLGTELLTSFGVAVPIQYLVLKKLIEENAEFWAYEIDIHSVDDIGVNLVIRYFHMLNKRTEEYDQLL